MSKYKGPFEIRYRHNGGKNGGYGGVRTAITSDPKHFKLRHRGKIISVRVAR